MNRAIHTRLSLVLAIAFGILVAEVGNIVAEGDSSDAAESVALVANSPVAPPAANAGIDNCSPPLLPLVYVQPSDQDLLSAETSALLAAVSSSAPTLSIPDLLPRVRLDMPYYSFGKMMPGATKE